MKPTDADVNIVLKMVVVFGIIYMAGLIGLLVLGWSLSA